MSILKHIFSNLETKNFYLENKDLESIKKDFEYYIFLIYEKVSLIVEIKNKYYDINSNIEQFIEEDIKKFRKKDMSSIKYGIIKTKDHKEYYYKKWLNQKLKRINKILNLETSFRKKLNKDKKQVNELILELRKGLNIDENDNQELEYFNSLLIKLNSVLNVQIKYFKKIYPVKEWSSELHKMIFSEEFMDAIKNELNAIFGTELSEKNYNLYPALISKSIHKHEIPLESYLGSLIAKNIKRIKNKTKNDYSEYVKCYHGRTIYSGGSSNLFPLNIESKQGGFFIDLDLNETIFIVQNIYNQIHNLDEIEIFEIIIPKNLFKLAYDDNIVGMLDEKIFHNKEIKHSFVFKPSTFTKLNEFYIKEIIKVRKLTNE